MQKWSDESLLIFFSVLSWFDLYTVSNQVIYEHQIVKYEHINHASWVRNILDTQYGWKTLHDWCTIIFTMYDWLKIWQSGIWTKTLLVVCKELKPLFLLGFAEAVLKIARNRFDQDGPGRHDIKL